MPGMRFGEVRGTLKVTGPDAEDSAVRTAITEAGYQVS